MNLEHLGWNEYWQEQKKQTPYRVEPVARVARVDKGGAVLRTQSGTLRGLLSSRMLDREQATRPSVGDWIIYVPFSDEEGLILEVLNRAHTISRKSAGRSTQEQVLAANLDRVFVVSSMNEDFNPNRLERFLAMAWQSGAQPVVLLTKADTCADPESYAEALQTVAPGVDHYLTSAVDESGLDAVRALVGPGTTSVFVGSSGVGKSTLINALAGEEVMATAGIREQDGKGRHTTTHRELILLPTGGVVIDTPGVRELGLWASETALDNTFSEIEAMSANCRFADCTHDREPACAVQGAVATGLLEQRRLDSFHKMVREMQNLQERTSQDQRWKTKVKNRSFGRLIKDAKRMNNTARKG